MVELPPPPKHIKQYRRLPNGDIALCVDGETQGTILALNPAEPYQNDVMLGTFHSQQDIEKAHEVIFVEKQELTFALRELKEIDLDYIRGAIPRQCIEYAIRALTAALA